MREMTDKEIRDAAMQSVMAKNNLTNNPVTRYISDAVAEKTVADERREPEKALPFLKGCRDLTFDDFCFEADAADLGDDGWSYYMRMTCNVDEIFGTNVETSENDDYINVYASVDFGYDGVGDILLILLWKGDGDVEEYRYMLSETEKKYILYRVKSHELKRLEGELAAIHAQLAIA